MKISIFLLCYNEEVLLPHTINHYKTRLPNANIFIYDNYSTDNSVNIAKESGCKIVLWDSNNEINDFKYMAIKNNCWKIVKDGWIIVADMDEWLCVTEEDLLEEEKNKTCLLTIRGYNMIGESKTETLEDLDFLNIKRAVNCPEESKSLCFYRPAICEMNYSPGAHRCRPIFSNEYAKTFYSKKTYINKHMNYLGLKYIIQKMIKRYERSHKMRQHKLATHYTNNIREISTRFFYLRKISFEM
jgi:glycosyltransferase involved in cell wall biosynthesis